MSHVPVLFFVVFLACVEAFSVVPSLGRRGGVACFTPPLARARCSIVSKLSGSATELGAVVGNVTPKKPTLLLDFRSLSFVALLKTKVVTIIGALVLMIFPFSRAASAASAIKGFDLYGRIPYDDWLFSTGRLIDPNLLKRSFVETIVQELPDVLGNFRKRKQLSEVWVVFSGLAYFFAGAVLVSVLYKGALAAGLRRGAAAQGKDDNSREFSASAISKKGPRKGKQLEGMDEGWLDMELSADDDDDDSDDKNKKK